MTCPTPHLGLVGVVIGGVVHVEQYSWDRESGGCTPDRPDPLARAHALITDVHRTVRYLTAPRWKRMLLRLFRWR
ncbi:MAG: hypothetical protein ACREJT_10020 [Myxococcota bacterium]